MARQKRESERLRVPPPLIKRRIPSGRGAMEQPNVTHDGDPAQPPVLARRRFDRSRRGPLRRRTHVDSRAHRAGRLQLPLGQLPGRRGGRLGGAANRLARPRRPVRRRSWYLIRRYLRHERSEIDEAVWSGDGELSIRRSLLTSVVSEVVVGAGASIGREAAPKLMGGVSGSLIARWFSLTPAQKRLLVACGGRRGTRVPSTTCPLAGRSSPSRCSTAVSRCRSCSRRSQPRSSRRASRGSTCPSTPLTSTFRLPLQPVAHGLVAHAGVVVGLLAVGYVRLIGWVSHYRAEAFTSFG